jgi:protein dithiol:quinone oxidoreductase
MRLPYRGLQLLGFAACAVGLAFALYLEHFQGLDPCPMCVFQRVAMLAAGVLFLIAALHGPRGSATRGLYAVLTAGAAGAGAFIAGRHVWLQSLPADQVPACGPSLDYLMDIMPLAEVLSTVLRGDGNCAVIDAAWLGISLPGWTLIAFVGMALFALAVPVLARARFD